jgi:hypothetical protein
VSESHHICIKVGSRELHYQLLGGLLFANSPGVHELVARCSSLDIAKQLAAQDAGLRSNKADGELPGGAPNE